MYDMWLAAMATYSNCPDACDHRPK